MRKLTKHRLFAALPALAALCFLASCASSAPESGNPETPATTSDGALLDDSSKAATSDANAFGDLSAPAPEAPAAAAPVEPPPASASAPAAEGDTFYNSYGGESLRRVALTLYSDKTFAHKLLERNPDLKGVKKLSAEQKVFFEMDSAKPEPRYLTKDLLARYPDQLAARIQSVTTEKGLAKSEVTVAKGESLQDLSQRLYGSHRYWPEIYLVNRDKLQNYDKVKAGMTLTVVNHPEAAAKAESAPAVARTEEPATPPPAPPVQEAPKEVKPLPVVTPVAAIPPPEPVKEPEPPVAIQPPPADPVPDTSVPPPAPVAEKAPAPVEPVPLPKVLEPMPGATAHVETNEPASANSSLRRVLYVVLILLIGGAAFYFTRTPKRPKIDMLDLNADPSAGRQKLAAAPKDTQRDQIG